MFVHVFYGTPMVVTPLMQNVEPQVNKQTKWTEKYLQWTMSNTKTHLGWEQKTSL